MTTILFEPHCKIFASIQDTINQLVIEFIYKNDDTVGWRRARVRPVGGASLFGVVILLGLGG